MGTFIKIFCFFAVLLLASETNAQTKTFQAETFLNMLSSSFDKKQAFSDLYIALHKRMEADPVMFGDVLNNMTSPAAQDVAAPAQPVTPTSCSEAPPREGAVITYTSPGRAVSSRAYYQCDIGYEGRSNIITCKAGGIWSENHGWPGCIAVECGTIPQVNNANAQPPATNTYGSAVIYTCRPGFSSQAPSPNVTCLENGQWETPAFTCVKDAPKPPAGMDFGAISNMFGGGQNQNAGGMMGNIMKTIQGMQNGQGMPQMGNMQSAPPSGGNNVMNQIQQMMQSMNGGGQAQGGGNNMASVMQMAMQNIMGNQQAAPTPPPTTPAPPPQQQQQQGFGGFQLPGHLQKLLPGGLGGGAGINSNDMRTLTSLGMGSIVPAAAPRDINALLGSMNLMGAMGGAGPAMPSLGLGGAGGKPGMAPDPEKMAEQREERMMRAMMASAMQNMMKNNRRQPNNNNGTAQAQRQQNPMQNFMQTMMPLLALGEGMSGGGGGAGGAGMDPMSMMLGGLNPAQLMGGAAFGSGGGGGMGNLMGSMMGMPGMNLNSLFGGA